MYDDSGLFRKLDGISHLRDLLSLAAHDLDADRVLLPIAVVQELRRALREYDALLRRTAVGIEAREGGGEAPLARARARRAPPKLIPRNDN